MASKLKRKTRNSKQAGTGDVDNVALADSSAPGAGATSPNEQVGNADAVGGATDQGAPGMDQVEQNDPTVPVTAGKRKAGNVTPGLQKRQKVAEDKDEDLAAKDGPKAPAGGASKHVFGAGRGRGTPRGNGRGMPRGNGRGRGAIAANGSGSGRGTLTPAPAVTIVVPRVAMPNRPPGQLNEAQRQDRIEQLKATTSAILSLADNAHRDAGRRLLRNYSNEQLKEIALEMKELMGMTAEDLEKLNRPHVKGHPLPETSPSAAEDDADEGDSLSTLSAPGSPMDGVLSELPPPPADPPAAPPSEAKTPLASPSAGPAATASPAAPSHELPQPRLSPVPPAGGNPDLSLLVNVPPAPSNPQHPAAPGATAPIPRRSAPPQLPPAGPHLPVPPQGGGPAANPPVPAQPPPAADQNDGSAPPPAGPQPPVPPQGGVPAADPPVPAQPPPADHNDGAAPAPSDPEPPSLIPKKPRRKPNESREGDTVELEYASDIDSSEAELVERERRAKPGPAKKEDIARIIAKQREIASWAEEEAERSSKSVDWVHRQLGVQMRLGRSDTSWNIYQEKWSVTEERLEGETPSLLSPDRLSLQGAQTINGLSLEGTETMYM